MKALNLIILGILTQFVSVSKSAESQQNIGSYKKEIILNIPFGSEPGEIGIDYIENFYNVGPSSFVVDTEGTIFILDSGNNRIMIYNNSGELLNYFTLKDQSHNFSIIRYDEEEKLIYIHTQRMNEFSIYSRTGTLLSTITYSDTLAVMDVFKVKNGNINAAGLIFYNELKEFENIENDITRTYNVVPQQDQVLTTIFYNTGKYSGNRYINISLDDYKNDIGLFQVIFPDNTISELDINDLFSEYYFRFEGETPLKEVLFYGIPNTRRERPRIMVKYNEKLQVVSVINDPEFAVQENFFMPYSLSVTELGEIYTLRIDVTGVRIIKWIME